VAWLWFHHLALLVMGLLIVAFGVVLLLGFIGGSVRYHQYDTMMRWLWSAVRHLPSGETLTDPATGATLVVERERGRTILAVTAAGQDSVTATVTRYVVGSGWAPAGPPPLLSHTAPADTQSLLRGRWLEWRLIALDVSTGGAMRVSSAEAAELWAQVVRTLGLEYRPR
jgi:hypothetical protein